MKKYNELSIGLLFTLLATLPGCEWCGTRKAPEKKPRNLQQELDTNVFDAEATLQKFFEEDSLVSEEIDAQGRETEVNNASDEEDLQQVEFACIPFEPEATTLADEQKDYLKKLAPVVAQELEIDAQGLESNDVSAKLIIISHYNKTEGTEDAANAQKRAELVLSLLVNEKISEEKILIKTVPQEITAADQSEENKVVVYFDYSEENAQEDKDSAE